MRKLLLLLAVCLALTVAGDSRPVPNFQEIPLEMYWELGDILKGINYREWKHEANVFDCSNQTAYLYDYLTARGYECEIMGGTDSLWNFLKGESHVWLIASRGGKRFWIDPVVKSIVAPSYYDEYFIKVHLGYLKTAKILFAIIGFPREWDY